MKGSAIIRLAFVKILYDCMCHNEYVVREANALSITEVLFVLCSEQSNEDILSRYGLSVSVPR